MKNIKEFFKSTKLVSRIFMAIWLFMCMLDVYKRQFLFSSLSICFLFQSINEHIAEFLRMHLYPTPVSYTHLDVYKRQPRTLTRNAPT